MFLAAAAAPGVVTDSVGLPTGTPAPASPARLVLVDDGRGGGHVRWRLESAGAPPVRTAVHDIRGRHVRRLAASGADGAWHLRWDGRNDAGRRVPAGVYLLRVRDGREVLHSRVVRLD